MDPGKKKIVIILAAVALFMIIAIIIVAVIFGTKKEETPVTPVTPPDEQKPLSPRLYTFYQGKDSYGNDMPEYRDASLVDNPIGLKALCDSTPGCIAFNTNAWPKSQVGDLTPIRAWANSPNKGIYVANL